MGEVFAGRYELLDPIGRGGVGAVWRAWDRRRRRYVAAKVLQQSDAHALLRFVREQALRIDHPHVLAPASWAADDDKVLFTMDLVAGGSLVHLVNDYGPLPPPFVCTLLDQLLAGVGAVHAEGVVHRDIKPANVLLEATGTARPRLRLSDFGIAMRLGEPRLTETNYVVGTPGYFAPEQMMGAEPDFPADLFAVGLVALYLLEGAKPDAKALIEYFAENGTPPAPQGIPEPLWQVVATLLQPDPQARFRTATGARKALAAAAELLPEPGPDDELVEVFDQLGPLPAGFGPEGPLDPLGRPPGGGPPGLQEAGADGSSEMPASAPLAPVDGSGPSPETGRGDAPPSHPRHAAPQLGLRRTTSLSESVAARGTGFGSGAGPGAEPGAGSEVGPESGRSSGSGQWHRGSGPWLHESGVPSQQPVSGGAWSDPDSGGVRQDPRSGGVRPDPTPVPADVQHTPAPGGVPPRPTPDAVPPQPSTMSDTGSFHLPPPQAPIPHAQPQPQSPPQHWPQPQPQEAWHETQQNPVPHHSQLPPAQPPTPPTAVALPAPTPAHAPPFDPTPTQVPHQPRAIPDHRAGRAQPRPGPPAKVAVPVLLLALACFAVGFWALTQI